MPVHSNYSEVFKAREKKSTKKFVAMKKVLMDNEKEGVCTEAKNPQSLYLY